MRVASISGWVRVSFVLFFMIIHLSINNLNLVGSRNPRHLATWTSRYSVLDISVLGPGHFGTDLDISVLGTGQFGTWMTQYSLLITIVWYLLIVNIFVLVVL